MKVLVTGAGGYIGSIACMRLLEEGYEVIAVDNFSAGYEAPLKLLQEKFGKKAFRYYNYDLCDDLTILFKKEKEIQSVIHFAGVCSIDESIKIPAKYYRNNFTATANLIEEMKKYGVNNIIFSSSCSVYKETPDEKPRTERDKLGPENPYGASKHLAEQTIQLYSKLYGLKYVILRYFNVCGAAPEGILGDSKNPSSLLVHNAVLGALGLEPFYATFSKVATRDGSPVRDYINVIDLVEAHINSLNYLDKNNKNNIFNLGTGIGHSVLEIIDIVKKRTGANIPLQFNNLRKGDYAKRVASYAKAEKHLKWKPQHSLDESIAQVIKWYQIHPQRWIV